MRKKSKIRHFIEHNIRAYYTHSFIDELRWRELCDYRYVWNSFLKLRAEGKYDEIQTKIASYWGRAWLQKGLDETWLNQFMDCIKTMDRSKEEFCTKYELLIQEMMKIPYKSLSVFQWKRFSGLMTSNGMFRLGYVCRSKAIERIKKEAKHSSGLLNGFTVYMEEQDYEKAIAILKRIRAKKLIRKYCRNTIDVFEDLYAVLTHDKMRLEENYKTSKGVEREYYNFINNQDIAIIGPSAAVLENPKEVQNKTVIRFNDRGQAILSEEQRDILTKISYYNGGCSKWIKESEQKAFLYDLKYIVCQGDIVDCFPEDVRDKIKIAKRINSLFLIGISNALPFALFDLCRCGKEKVEVYCNNLYLSKKVWSEKYNIHSENQKKEMFWWPILAQHEMTSQFTFLQNMYKIGVIQADEELKWVLEHKPIEYVTEMEQLWVMDVIPYRMNTDWENAK